MTAIVSIRCTDGVVIGSDSSATFTAGRQRLIEQPTEKKIQIVGDWVIVGGSGAVGFAQRYVEVVKSMWKNNNFHGKTALEIAKALSAGGINDFLQTGLQQFDFSAFVAFVANDEPHLCELPPGEGKFQPELKEPDDLWYASTGSGQPLTDPFLALLRSVFWPNEPPNLQGGIFTTVWALKHACELNPGGIKEPIKVATLARHKGKWRARLLDPSELKEHEDMVTAATDHLGQFKTTLLGKSGAQPLPKPS